MAAAPVQPSRRRVLVLAKHFPPIGGAGVHRTVGTVRYLPEHGYEPVVVTGGGTRTDRWTPSDPTLLGRLSPETEIHRLTSEEPPGLTGKKERLYNLLQVPPPWVPWWIEAATQVGVKVGVGADLVLASGIPYETTYAGAAVAKRLGVPWIADLEDPWALDEMRVQSTALHHKNDLRRMRAGLATAAAVIMCADEAAERVRHALPELRDRIVVSIPIGFDRDDFPAADAAEHPAGVLRIVHTGTMHTNLGRHHQASEARRRRLGGTSVGVNLLTRSHVYLMDAIDAVLARNPELAGRIELQLAGVMSDADLDAIGGRDYVHVAGTLAHDATLALMRSADLLFLPMHEMPEGQRAGLIPYKTYEYLGAERPILAAVPDGDVRRILSGIEHATVVGPSDTAAMAEAIEAAARRGRVEHVKDGVGSPALAPYERRHSVAQIADVFDRVLNLKGQTP